MGVEEAIPLAIDYVHRLFGGTDHRLEEVEVRDKGEFDVTVSYRTPDAPRPVPLAPDSALLGFRGNRAAIGVDPSRIYKDVLISPDGKVKAVRIRQITIG